MEYKKITEVELIEEPSENAAVLAEDNGKLRRVPFKKVGGSGLPSGGAPHQMLVTDADGKTVWTERTHYKEKIVESLLENLTITTTTDDEMKMDGLPSAFFLESGRTYEVVFDGVSYIQPVREASVYGKTAIYIGDVSSSGYIDDATGEPFGIMSMGDASDGLAILVIAEPGEHTFSMSINETKYHPLEVEYIPESVRITETVNVVSLEETTFTVDDSDDVLTQPNIFVYELPKHVVIENGRTYSIEFDGVMYEETAYQMKPAGSTEKVTAIGLPAYLIATSGNTNFVHPFNVSDDGTATKIRVQEVGEHTISISYNKAQVPEDKLPNMSALRMVSPSGTVFNVTVSDDGMLSATAM